MFQRVSESSPQSHPGVPFRVSLSTLYERLSCDDPRTEDDLVCTTLFFLFSRFHSFSFAQSELYGRSLELAFLGRPVVWSERKKLTSFWSYVGGSPI